MNIKDLEDFIALAKANGASQSTNVRCEIQGISGDAWGCHHTPESNNFTIAAFADAHAIQLHP